MQRLVPRILKRNMGRDSPRPSNVSWKVWRIRCSSTTSRSWTPGRLHRTTALNGLNAEIRRRSRVVGVFPSTGSYMRLLVCYLMEYQDDNETGRSYLSSESIREQRQLNDARVA